MSEPEPTPAERLATAAERARREHVHLRSKHADHTMSFSRIGSRVTVRLSPDRPLDYGYEEAGTILEEQDLQRLAYWIVMGTALDRDAKVPKLGVIE